MANSDPKNRTPRIATMMAIGYLMAVSGSEPLRSSYRAEPQAKGLNGGQGGFTEESSARWT